MVQPTISWLPILSLFTLFTSQSTFVLAADSDKPCTLRHKDKYYDLNPLARNQDYEIDTDQGHKFKLNVCRPMADDQWHVSAPDKSKVAGVLRRDHGDLSIGEYNTTVSWSHTHLQLLFTNGSPCGKESEDGLRASTVVEFRCDHSTGHVGTPRLLAQLPPNDEQTCGFFVEWRTSYACPKYESSMGFFSILFVTVASLLSVYLIVGVLHNRFVLGLSGYDQIPQFSIASMKYHATEAYSLAKDYISGLQTSRPGGLGRAGYQGVPKSTDEEAGSGFRLPSSRGNMTSSINPFSHQSQSASEGSGFVRPSTAGKARAFDTPASATNPVSHQTQVIADTAAIQSQSQQQPARTAGSPQSQSNGLTGQQLQSRRLVDVSKDAGKAKAEEKEFMLGEEGDDEEDEDEDDEDEDDEESEEEPSQSEAHGKSTSGTQPTGAGSIRL
jgi:hypothetical protein